MQCKRCGTDIPNSEVFCPKCGEEIQLVPDYNSVEYMFQQKNADENLLRRKEQQEKRMMEQKKKKRKMIIWLIVLFLVLFAGLVIGGLYFLRYSRDNSYDYQYKMAYEAYESEDYDAAELYGQRALELHPTSDNALLLLAETRLHKGNNGAGIELFMEYIEKHPDSIEAYARVISVYEEEENFDKIRGLFEACNNDIILTEFSGYIPSDIKIINEPGAYDKKVTFELEYSEGTIYYTTDGTIPDQNSEKYIEPIQLEEGTTKFKMICYSPANIPGDVVSAEYTVTLPIPNPPFISPASGDYDIGTQITIVVPEGCKAYYTFDGVANSESKLYTGPVAMPEGEHVFSAILIDGNEKQSYPASEIYVVG